MQKQTFNKEKYNKFIEYFQIKEEPSEIEEDFYKKTEQYLKYIKWVPWLKMVWIWNSISMNCADKDSDIDLFIITDKNRIWTVRIMITLIFQILWVRKDDKNHAWRFCLSFFSTTSWMNFKNFALEDDIYLFFWIIYLKPILDYDNTYQKFLESNETWCNFWWYENILTNNLNFIKHSNNKNKHVGIAGMHSPQKWFNSKIRKTCLSSLQKILKFPWDILEFIIKLIFLQKSLNTYNKLWKPFWVIINNDMLKFHNDDIREKIKKEIV